MIGDKTIPKKQVVPEKVEKPSLEAQNKETVVKATTEATKGKGKFKESIARTTKEKRVSETTSKTARRNIKVMNVFRLDELKSQGWDIMP